MKIGGGALQSMIGQEVKPVQKIESLEKKKPEETVLDPGINKPVPKEDELIKAVENMNSTVDLLNRDIKFQIHERTQRVIIEVIDRKTDEVIREIPPEAFLDMVANVKETMGLLVDKYV